VTSQDGHTETRVVNNSAYVTLANFSEEALDIPKATILGIAEQIPEPLVNKINAKSGTNSNPTKPRRQKTEALYNKLLQGKQDHLSQEEKEHTASTFKIFSCLL
jgi:hypothetical protein